jgi:hypothetical protein
MKTNFVSILTSLAVSSAIFAHAATNATAANAAKVDVSKLVQNTSAKQQSAIKTDATNKNIKAPKQFQSVDQSLFLKFGGNSGGGGDDVGLEFQASLNTALKTLSKNDPQTYQMLLNEGLASAMSLAKYIVVDDTLLVDVKDLVQNSVAVNVPDQLTILINRSRWKALRGQPILMSGIALHEMNSLLKIESTGMYAISSRYVQSQGGSGKDLDSSVQVNHLIQIKALSPFATPAEILKKFFDEAHAEISANDFGDLDGSGRPYSKLYPVTGDYKCQMIYNANFPNEVTETKFGKYLTNNAKKDLGPLLPATEENSYIIMDANCGDEHGQATDAWPFACVKNEISIDPASSKTELTMTAEGGFTFSYRKSGNMIAIRYSDPRNVYHGFGYCYPTDKK